MERTAGRVRWGFTLLELVIVVAIIGLVVAGGIRALGRHLDRMAVRSAVAEAAGALARARDEALARHAVVAVRIDTGAATVVLRIRGNRIARYALGHEHGVTLTTSRDSIAFDDRGLGYGAANLTLVARRGAAADTLVVSRLGRVRFQSRSARTAAGDDRPAPPPTSLVRVSRRAAAAAWEAPCAAGAGRGSRRHTRRRRR